MDMMHRGAYAGGRIYGLRVCVFAQKRVACAAAHMKGMARCILFLRSAQTIKTEAEENAVFFHLLNFFRGLILLPCALRWARIFCGAQPPDNRGG